MPNMNLKGAPPTRPTPGAKPAPGGEGEQNKKKKILGLPMPIALGVAGVLGVGLVVGILYLTGVIGEKPKPKFERPVPPVEASLVDTVSLEKAAPIKTVTKEEPKPVKKVEKKDTKNKINNGGKNKLASFSNGSGAFSIQVESWGSDLKARSRAQVYTNAGFNAFVEKGGRKNYYRVFIGRYPTKKEARNAAEKISHMLEAGYSITKLN